MYEPTKGASNFSNEEISNFSPITPVCSINFSATVIPSKSEFKKLSLFSQFIAIAAKEFASSLKESFFATKSVSHAKTIATPEVMLSFILTTAIP